MNEMNEIVKFMSQYLKENQIRQILPHIKPEEFRVGVNNGSVSSFLLNKNLLLVRPEAKELVNATQPSFHPISEFLKQTSEASDESQLRDLLKALGVNIPEGVAIVGDIKELIELLKEEVVASGKHVVFGNPDETKLSGKEFAKMTDAEYTSELIKLNDSLMDSGLSSTSYVKECIELTRQRFGCEDDYAGFLKALNTADSSVMKDYFEGKFELLDKKEEEQLNIRTIGQMLAYVTSRELFKKEDRAVEPIITFEQFCKNSNCANLASAYIEYLVATSPAQDPVSETESFLVSVKVMQRVLSWAINRQATGIKELAVCNQFTNRAGVVLAYNVGSEAYLGIFTEEGVHVRELIDDLN